MIRLIEFLAVNRGRQRNRNIYLILLAQIFLSSSQKRTCQCWHRQEISSAKQIQLRESRRHSCGDRCIFSADCCSYKAFSNLHFSYLHFHILIILIIIPNNLLKPKLELSLTSLCTKCFKHKYFHCG